MRDFVLLNRALLLIILTVAISLPLWATEVTIVGDDSYPPYSYNDRGTAKGIYADIIHAAVNKIPNYSANIKTAPWKRGLALLKLGKIAFLYPPYKRPKERPYMGYSVPILEEELKLFCRKDLMFAPRSSFPHDYKALLIGENLGFSSGVVVSDAKKAGIIRLSSTKGTAANLKKLIAKRLDCYINDRLSILSELKMLQIAGSYDGVSIVEAATLSVEQGYLGITNRGAPAYAVDFIKAFNRVILDMQKNGEIEAIVKSYTQ